MSLPRQCNRIVEASLRTCVASDFVSRLLVQIRYSLAG